MQIQANFPFQRERPVDRVMFPADAPDVLTAGRSRIPTLLPAARPETETLMGLHMGTRAAE